MQNVMLDCGIKANCPHLKPVPLGECPPWSSFQGILARIYVSFGKFRTARSTSATGVWTWHLPSSSFECYCCATGGTYHFEYVLYLNPLIILYFLFCIPKSHKILYNRNATQLKIYFHSFSRIAHIASEMFCAILHFKC